MMGCYTVLFYFGIFVGIMGFILGITVDFHYFWLSMCGILFTAGSLYFYAGVDFSDGE